MPESEQRFERLEQQAIEYDARLDKIELDMQQRTNANRSLLEKRFLQIRQMGGIFLATIGLTLALYIAWGEINSDLRSQISYDFLKGALSLALGVGGGLLVIGKKQQS